MNRRSFLLAASTLPVVMQAAGSKSYTFGLVAKSQGNAVFQVARVGAEDAARGDCRPSPGSASARR